MPSNTGRPVMQDDEGSLDHPNLTRLLGIMKRLRDPDTGCPWDVEQDFATIAPYTIEEAYEVADAIARDDIVSLREELGDLLLQVVFHAQMAEELGYFSFDDVAAAIAEKLVLRHPHVFGDGDREAFSVDVWEASKAEERARKAAANGVVSDPATTPTSALDDVALALPALTRAEKLQKRAARVGFDWQDPAPVLDKIEEEIGELRAEMESDGGVDRITDEVGDLLFSVVNLARKLNVDPEACLRAGNAKFIRRFQAIEASLRAQDRDPKDANLDELEALWQAVKINERSGE